MQITKTAWYNSSSIVGWIIVIVGGISIKLIAIIIVIYSLDFFKNGLRWVWSDLLALPVYLIALCVGWVIGKFVMGYGFKIIKYGNKFRLPLKEVPEPTFEQYELKPEQFYQYNRRFQILNDAYLIFLFILIGCLVFALNFYHVKKGILSVALIIVIAAAITFLILRVIKIINSHLSNKYPQRQKSEAYSKALKAYRIYTAELRERRLEEE